jgi:hypothetical protein
MANQAESRWLSMVRIGQYGVERDRVQPLVTLYPLPSLNAKLIPQLEKLKPGSRIVAHDFDMAGVTPDQIVRVTSSNGAEHRVFLWTTPPKKETDTSAQ